MHEFSLAQEILKIVEETAAANELSSITEVRLTVGVLSGVNTAALSFGWDFVRRGSGVAATADLSIEPVPGKAACTACGYEGNVSDYVRICPACNNLGLRFTQGEEFLVTGLSGE